VNCSNPRVRRHSERNPSRPATVSLETSDTDRRFQRSPRNSVGLTRSALLPLLSCALLGIAPIVGRADDAPKSAATAQAPTAQPAPQPAPTPPPPAPGSVTITGLVDLYYSVNPRRPSSPTGKPFPAVVTASGETINVDNLGRAFDINDSEPTFSLGELNITRLAGAGFPFGITVTLTAGDTARLVHANEPGGTSSWQTFQQGYLTYTTKALKRDFTFDFGKFVTPFGYEVIESVNNDNYTRGFLFNYAVPLYHAGLRVGFPINNQISFLGAIVNGWNNVADDNNAKSAIAQFTYKITPTLTGILGYMGGAEGTGAYGAAVPTNGGGSITTNLGEFQAIWQTTPKLKLVAWVDYANAAGSVLGTHLSGNWFGVAGYGRYQITSHFAVAARAEQFEDMPGVGGVGLRLGGPYQKLRSGTITLEYTSFRGHLVSRLEYRHDHANTQFFGGANGRTFADSDTYTLGEVYKF
jgi:hypothetical protein